MITRVTITGADDTTDPKDLQRLTNEFPFVEWGILVSRKSGGAPRFPSLSWIKQFTDASSSTNPLPMSLHVCGAYVREILKAEFQCLHNENQLESIWPIFKRVQLNTHAEKHEYHHAFMALLKSNPDKEFIFQYDNVNNDMVHATWKECKNIAALFDLSHGAGRLPESWPVAMEDIRCGYAGGLSPYNLKEQIESIDAAGIGKKIWIDVETHVRSSDNSDLDLNKVYQFLEIAKPYVAV